MISRLTGRLLEKEPHQVLIDVGGVGYQAFIPLSTFYSLPPDGEEVTLRIYTHVREDQLALFGFGTRDEQDLFEKLIEISGIGPRLALAILSGLPAGDLIAAIADGDAARLRSIPGVGPKTADRVVLELRDRVRTLQKAREEQGREARVPGARPGRSVTHDVVSALVNLGYRENQAENAVRRAIAEGRGDDGGHGEGAADGPADGVLQSVLKRSLRYLAS